MNQCKLVVVFHWLRLVHFYWYFTGNRCKEKSVKCTVSVSQCTHNAQCITAVYNVMQDSMVSTAALTHVKVKKRVEITSSRMTVMDTGMQAPAFTRSPLPVAISALSTHFSLSVPKTQHISNKQYRSFFLFLFFK